MIQLASLVLGTKGSVTDLPRRLATLPHGNKTPPGPAPAAAYPLQVELAELAQPLLPLLRRRRRRRTRPRLVLRARGALKRPHAQPPALRRSRGTPPPLVPRPPPPRRRLTPPSGSGAPKPLSADTSAAAIAQGKHFRFRPRARPAGELPRRSGAPQRAGGAAAPSLRRPLSPAAIKPPFDSTRLDACGAFFYFPPLTRSWRGSQLCSPAATASSRRLPFPLPGVTRGLVRRPRPRREPRLLLLAGTLESAFCVVWALQA